MRHGFFFVAAAILTPSAWADVKPSRPAVILATEGKVPGRLLKQLSFKIDVALRGAGHDPVSLKPFQDELPGPDDPWFNTCIRENLCASGLAKKLGADNLIVLRVVRAGKRFNVGAVSWSAHGSPPPIESTWLTPDQAQTEGVQLVLDTLNALKAASPPPAEPTPDAPEPINDTMPVTTPTTAGDHREAELQTILDEHGANGEPPPARTTELEPPTPSKPPEPCVNVFKDSVTPPAREGGAPVFVKPKVLQLPLARLREVRSRNSELFESAIQQALLGNFQLKRNDYVTHCTPSAEFDNHGKSLDHRALSLAEAKTRGVSAAEWVFQVTLLKWAEESAEDSFEIESAFSFQLFRVRDRRLEPELEETIEVPEMLDLAVFEVENQARQAQKSAMDSAGGAGELVDSALQATGMKMSPEDEEYDFKIRQNLRMAGKKLALALRNHPRFRLSSPIVKRNDDEAGIAVGDSEGVSLNDTFLFYRGDPDDWDGFGRITTVGAGGAQGRAAPSWVEVISDYEGDSSAIEYPLLGIQIAAGVGLLPMSHSEALLVTDQEISETGLGAFAFGLNVDWRIPWLPIAELYETNTVSYALASPLEVMAADVGLEKRWLWGRVSPALGLRYSIARVGLPVPSTAGGADPAMAHALAHGMEGYGGVGFFLHPVWTLRVVAGYRYFFQDLVVFSLDDNDYFATDANGETWSLGLSGLLAKVMVSYEF